jgi:CRP/FNR family transcriptional regulator
MTLATVWSDSETVRRPTASAKARYCENCAAHALSICSVMRAEDLGRLASARNSQAVEAGKTFLNEGDAAAHFFTIGAGAVKVYKLMPDGRRQVTGFLFAGDLLGLAVNDVYTYSAEALTDVTLCRFPRRQLGRLLDEFPKM